MAQSTAGTSHRATRHPARRPLDGRPDAAQTFNTPEWVTPAGVAGAVKFSFTRK
jgi:hypothetical protein